MKTNIQSQNEDVNLISELKKASFRKVISYNPQSATIITKTVCSEFDVNEVEMFSKYRGRRVLNAKKCFSFIVSEILRQGPKQTGIEVGVTHASIINEVKRFKNHYSLEPKYREKADKVFSLLLSQAV